MRFLVRKSRAGKIADLRQKYRWLKPLLATLAIAYPTTGIWLYLQQEQLLYQPNYSIAAFAPEDFLLVYQDVWIDVPNSVVPIHGWWFDAPKREQPVIAIPNEPSNVLTSPKTMLYFCGRGGSKTHYNNLARIQSFQQLGFSVLAIDYRGYGLSEGQLPNETRVYQDARAAWSYLIEHQNLKPQNIVIYGESLGGAVAIDLAVNQPNAAGLIVQSSFTSMPAQAKEYYPVLNIFPLDLILHQRFASINKIERLLMPVLFIHGTADSVVNYQMSQELYAAAPEPKTLFYIPGAEHLRLYQAENSYLLAIKNFVLGLERSEKL